ncbi:protein tyrosine phosphatase, non-receptor type 12 [Nowakowskiella sp. JEL0407]|nr:protein tyrosine phosphatase, non-receptor type 12 [Nowakowskiella sp. JEL0407]
MGTTFSKPHSPVSPSWIGRQELHQYDTRDSHRTETTSFFQHVVNTLSPNSSNIDVRRNNSHSSNVTQFLRRSPKKSSPHHSPTSPKDSSAHVHRNLSQGSKIFRTTPSPRTSPTTAKPPALPVITPPSPALHTNKHYFENAKKSYPTNISTTSALEDHARQTGLAIPIKARQKSALDVTASTHITFSKSPEADGSLTHPIVDSLKVQDIQPNSRGSLASRRSSNSSRYSEKWKRNSNASLDISRTPSLQPSRLDIASLANIPRDSSPSPHNKPGKTFPMAAADLSLNLLPLWLRKLLALSTDDRAKHLTKLYRDIESTEKARLNFQIDTPTTALTQSYSSSSLEIAFESFDMNASSSSTYSFASTTSRYAANHKSNYRRNRYEDIVPFDYNRVQLETPFNTTDYINASYIGGFPGCKTYIAAQAPLDSTIPEFWQMIWERRTGLIVMLTPIEEHGRIKSAQYWPEKIGTHITYHDTTVLLEDEERIPTENSIICREFVVTRNGETRKIAQVHFEGWEDHAANNARSVLTVVDFANSLLRRSILEVRQHLYFKNRFDVDLTESEDADERIDNDDERRQVPQPPPTPDLLASSVIGPMVVHCSAGCGRTGTFVAIDTCLTLLDRMLNLQAKEREKGASAEVENDEDQEKSRVLFENRGRRMTLTSDSPTTPLGPSFEGHYNQGVKKFLQGITADQDLVVKIVKMLREQRISSVQTIEQFAFVYEVILVRLSEWRDAGRKLIWDERVSTTFADPEETPLLAVHGRSQSVPSLPTIQKKRMAMRQLALSNAGSQSAVNIQMVPLKPFPAFARLARDFEIPQSPKTDQKKFDFAFDIPQTPVTEDKKFDFPFEVPQTPVVEDKKFEFPFEMPETPVVEEKKFELPLPDIESKSVTVSSVPGTPNNELYEDFEFVSAEKVEVEAEVKVGMKVNIATEEVVEETVKIEETVEIDVDEEKELSVKVPLDAGLETVDEQAIVQQIIEEVTSTSVVSISSEAKTEKGVNHKDIEITQSKSRATSLKLVTVSKHPSLRIRPISSSAETAATVQSPETIYVQTPVDAERWSKMSVPHSILTDTTYRNSGLSVITTTSMQDFKLSPNSACSVESNFENELAQVLSRRQVQGA